MVLYLIIFLIIIAVAGIIYILKYGKKGESRAIMKESPNEIQPVPTFKIVQKPSFLEKQKEIQPGPEIQEKISNPNNQQTPQI
jgi:hypothetical protein